MKIVVIGGTGLISAKTSRLTEDWVGPSTTHGIENENVTPGPLFESGHSKRER